MVKHMQDWEPIFHKIIAKRSEKKLSVDKAVRKAARRAQKESNLTMEQLIAGARKFLSLGKAKSLLVTSDSVSLRESPATAKAVAEQHNENPTDQQQPAKKRKMSEGSKLAVSEDAGDTAAVPSAVQPHDDAAANIPGRENATPVSQNQTKGKKAVKTKAKSATASSPDKGGEQSPTELNPPGKAITAEKKSKSQAGAINSSKKRKKIASRKASEEGGIENVAAVAEQDESMPIIQGEEKTWAESRNRKEIKHGIFSKAEKEALKAAAVEFAKERGLDEDNFDWLFRTKTGEQRALTAGAWKAIASNGLPHRSIRAVWACGTRFLHPSHYKGAWTSDELAKLQALVDEKGRRWKPIGDELDRLPSACRDKYRELQTRTGEHARGRWKPEENKRLQEAVAEYLATKQDIEDELASPKAVTLSFEDVPSPAKEQAKEDDGRALLDDVDWNFIASKVGTRSRVQCMDRWYRILAPSMVSQGEWGMGDDRRLLKGLLLADARQQFLVPWDDVVKGRTAQQCKRRWNLMIKRVPDKHEKDFTQQLDYLVDTFAPGLRGKVQAQMTSAE